jgi:serine/threonine protein kinase/dipeptidyl aminopeptidase/acylaminoacyl peptidase
MPSEQEHDELVMSLVESVMKHPPEERPARLQALCRDPALHEEVRVCIEWEERMGGFLLDPLIHWPTAEHVFPAGYCLGERFRIIRKVGHGGMAIVYEAMDRELDRRVALKCAKPGHRNRLPPEARAAREVSHFHVCKVHDLHKASTDFGEMDFLSMEFIEGETLAQRIDRDGPLPKREAREIALQICSGLEQAHRQGVIHGDLKCSNIILARAPEGGMRAVITDFGLAKLKFAEGSHLMSVRGGTFDYMAPELFCGESATVASDLYALGVLFHAMLTGSAPRMLRPSLARELIQSWNWKAGSQTSTAALDRAIIDADWQRPIEELPSPWKRVVSRCLTPQPKDRFASAEAVNQVLVRRSAWFRWAAAAAALVIAPAAGWLVSPGNQASRLEGLVQLTPATELSGSPSLSRDGRVIVYESDRAEPGKLDIWIQQLPGGEVRRLTTDPSEANDPNVSPDGRTVVFRSERNGGGIYVIDTAGGIERLFATGGRNPQFSPEGQRVVYWTGDVNESVPSGRVYVSPLGGGPPIRLAAGFEDARVPIWSPDGRFVLFSGCRSPGQSLRACSDWWVTSADGSSSFATGAIPLLRRQQINPRDTWGGWHGEQVIFGGTHEDVNSLWELTISRRDLRAVGRPRQLTSGDASEAEVTVAEDGSIAFGRLSAALHVWRIDHAAIPRDVSPSKVTAEAAVDICPNVSRDGHWLVFGRGSRTHRDIWVKDLRSGVETASVVSKFDKASPLIDDAGTTIVYEQREPQASTIWISRDRSQRKLCTGCDNPTGWFGENEAFFYSGNVPSRIMIADLKTGTSRAALEGHSGSVGNADWSPANQYLLFTASPDGSRKQIFAVRFPHAIGQPAGNSSPVTSESELSDRPRWSGDGKTVFYLSNRDGFYCVWGQHFDSVLGKVTGAPFAVRHFHNTRISPGGVKQSSFAMAVSGDSVFLNLGEVTESIWTGKLRAANLFHFRSIY